MAFNINLDSKLIKILDKSDEVDIYMDFTYNIRLFKNMLELCKTFEWQNSGFCNFSPQEKGTRLDHEDNDPTEPQLPFNKSDRDTSKVLPPPLSLSCSYKSTLSQAGEGMYFSLHK